MSFPDESQVDTVAAITGFCDRAIIANALQASSYNVESVINEYFDSADKFERKYGWDESAFSSNREGEPNQIDTNTGPSFLIQPPDDNPVIYGTEPNNFYGAGAPSRPPSRTNNRSPMSRLVDMTANEYTTDTPSSRQEEEAQLQRAITESLHASGVQSPPTLPPPPARPPPLPQQSGITSTGESSVYFGPANRPDYATDEWAMVRLHNDRRDPGPSMRARKPGMPVLLRCSTDSWDRHRIGALLTIFNEIPAVRNVLLRTGEPPAYGYGNNSNWWKGEAILPPGRENEDQAWAQPPWSDELHRLMAFLEATERSYGSADLLSRARYPPMQQTNDTEKDFFQSLFSMQQETGNMENVQVLDSSVEVVAFEDASLQSVDHFALLDLQIGPDAAFKTLYNVLDSVFFSEARQAMETPNLARMAWITSASEVLTFRLQAEDGLRKALEIPETFYIDRYLKDHGSNIWDLQRDITAVTAAFDTSFRREELLTKWVNPRTKKTYDRRLLIKAAIRRCQENIRNIQNRAFWREHEQASPDRSDDYYLPEHVGEPGLPPDEAKVVGHYSAKIQELEEELAKIDHVMNSTVLPHRRELEALNRKMSALLTVPTADEKWNPTHKYTLRGVVSDPDTVFLRVNAPHREQESIATHDESGSGESQWLKLSYKTEGQAVEHTPVSYETVVREGCGIGSMPVLVYATDKALQEERIPLPDALKSFVKHDNRHFKQELSQSEQLPHTPEKRRSAGLEADSQSKRLQRSSSMDSMATNQASVGDLDDDMRDAPFDDDSMFGPVNDFITVGTGDQDDMPDLVEMSDQPREPSSDLRASLPTPPYDSDVDMETDVSPALDPEAARLAQVSLQDIKSNSGSKGPEMQERPNSPFITRPSNGMTNGAAAEPNVLANYSTEDSIDDRLHRA